MREEYLDKRIAGVRRWRVVTGADGKPFLYSTGIDPAMSMAAWMPGRVKKANCFIDSDHLPPDPDCTCGLYAYYDFMLSASYHRMRQGHEIEQVYGVISGWGDPLIMDEYGFRAQYAEIEAIVVHKKTRKVLDTEISVMDVYLDISNNYNVPLIEVDDIRDFAKEQGLAVLGSQDAPREEKDEPSDVMCMDGTHTPIYNFPNPFGNNAPPPPRPRELKHESRMFVSGCSCWECTVAQVSVDTGRDLSQDVEAVKRMMLEHIDRSLDMRFFGVPVLNPSKRKFLS